MNELRRDADTIADSSDDAEHSCDDIRLAWLCAELAPGRTFRAPPSAFAALWADR
jgi:hypothetical protein